MFFIHSEDYPVLAGAITSGDQERVDLPAPDLVIGEIGADLDQGTYSAAVFQDKINLMRV